MRAKRWVEVVAALCLVVVMASASAYPAADAVARDGGTARAAAGEVEKGRGSSDAARGANASASAVLPAARSVERDDGSHASAAVQETVSQANAAARIEPNAVGFVNAMQVWAYSPASLYQVYTRPGRITDIALQAGEQLVDISAPDTVRWMVGNTTSGERESERVHVSIKPTRADLQTNLIIYTNRRTYYLEVMATPATWMAAVSWEYPPDKLAGANLVGGKGGTDRARVSGERGARVADGQGLEGIALERLNFGYEVTGARVAWRPVRAFDDGAKVYVQFPSDIAQHDLPPLFVVGAKGALELVNYRVQSPYYVIDRLFDVAELRLGDRNGAAVRIARVDREK